MLALLGGVGIGIGRRPIIDLLLQEGKLVPLFRNRAIGKAAYLVRSPTARSPVAQQVADWLIGEPRPSGETGPTGGIGAGRSGGRKMKQARGHGA